MIDLTSRFPCREEFFQVFCHPDCLLHEVGADHPETPERLQSILRGCARLSPDLPISWQVPCPAQIEDLSRVHDPDYLARLERACGSGQPHFMSPDNQIGPQSFRAVLAAGGCALALAKTLLGQGAGIALIRPPGHHAGKKRAEGFCFINHTALVIETIRRHHPQAAFLVVDFDAHHGHGLNFLYYDDARVFYYSLHGEPEHIYPNTGYRQETGRGAATGCTCNITLPLDTSGDRWLQQFDVHLHSFEKKIHPDYLLVNAGFDAHQEDPFGVMNVGDIHFREAVKLLQAVADKYCRGRIGLLLEGGYSMTVLERLLPEIIVDLALARATAAAGPSGR